MNKELIRKLARKLRRLRHEKHFNQGRWMAQTACGTAACIAGHAVLVAGIKVNLKLRDDRYGNGEVCITEDGQDEIQTVARRVFGIDDVTARRLFSGRPADTYRLSTYWPEEYAKRWKRGERKSRIAADLLDAIADGEVDLSE